MPSTYSTNLLMEKQATNENTNTWGVRLNDSVIDLIDQAISGVTTIAFGTTAGDCAITNANGALAQGRNAVLVLTGAPVSNVALNVPAKEKLYGIRSKHTGGNWIKVRPVGAPLGTEVTLDAGSKAIAYTDGNRMYRLTENNATSISAAMLPLVQAATTALGRAALDVPRNATKAEVSAASAGDQSPSTSQLGFAILHGFKKYTDASGSPNTIAVTCNPVPTSYSEIESLYIRVANTNTSTTVNLNCNALGDIRVKIPGQAGSIDPLPGQLQAGTFYEFVRDTASNVFVCQNPTQILPDTSLSGLELSYSSTTVYGIAAGFARNEDSGPKVSMVLSSAFTKTTGAWVAGTGNGSLDTGSVAINTWYHVHLIQNNTTGAVDILLSTSATSPTMPSGYVARRRIGSLKTATGTTSLLSFYQRLDDFYWDVPVIDYSSASTGTTAVTQALTTPNGVAVYAKIALEMRLTSTGLTNYGLILPTSTTNTTPSSTATNFFVISGGDNTSKMLGLDVLTNTSRSIRWRFSLSSSDVFVSIITLGWTDPRGK